MARIYSEIKARPVYIVAERSGFELKVPKIDRAETMGAEYTSESNAAADHHVS